MTKIQKIVVKPNKKDNNVYYQEKTLFNEDSDVLVVETTEPPIEGRANKKVIELLSDFFEVKKSQISIKSGLKSKFKTVIIS